MPYWRADFRWGDACTRRRTPEHRQPHQGIAVIRTFEQQPEIALQFTVIGGEQDIGVIQPTPRGELIDDASAGGVNQFVLNVIHRIDFANLIRRQIGGTKISRRFQVAPQGPIVVAAPLLRFGVEPTLGCRRILWIQLRQRHIAPRHAPQFTRWGIPRMMRIGETQPDKPVRIRGQGLQPINGALRYPVGVIKLFRHVVVPHLNGPSVATATAVLATGCGDHWIEIRARLGMLSAHP